MLKFYEVDAEYIEYLSIKDFSKEENQYKILLRKELQYCNSNVEKIYKQANDIYKLGLKENTRNKFNICDFKKLEEICLQYMKSKNK